MGPSWPAHIHSRQDMDVKYNIPLALVIVAQLQCLRQIAWMTSLYNKSCYNPKSVMSSWKAPLVFGTVWLYKHSCITTTAIMHTQTRRQLQLLSWVCTNDHADTVMQCCSQSMCSVLIYSYIPHAPQTYCLFIYMHQPGRCTVYIYCSHCCSMPLISSL